MIVNVGQLKAGDVIRFSEESPHYTLTGITRHSNISELRHLNFKGGSADCTMPATATVVGVELPRIVKVPCFLCKGSYAVLTELVTGRTPRAVICPDCDATTTREVMQRMEDGES